MAPTILPPIALCYCATCSSYRNKPNAAGSARCFSAIALGLMADLKLSLTRKHYRIGDGP